MIIFCYKLFQNNFPKVFVIFLIIGGFPPSNVQAHINETCPPLDFKGAINEKYSITLSIDDSIALLDNKQYLRDGKFTGRYTYDRYNMPIEFKSTDVIEDDILIYEETGTFKLKFDSGKLIGEWVNSNTGKTLPVSLKPVSTPLTFQHEGETFHGEISLIIGQDGLNIFEASVLVNNYKVILYSWRVDECIDNDFKGPSFNKVFVNGQKLIEVSWLTEYKAPGMIDSPHSLLIHTSGTPLKLNSGSWGSSFGMFDFERHDCSLEIKHTHIERVCISTKSGSINDGKSTYRLTENKSTAIYNVTDQGFIEGEKKVEFRETQGKETELFMKINEVPWQSNSEVIYNKNSHGLLINLKESIKTIAELSNFIEKDKSGLTLNTKGSNGEQCGLNGFELVSFDISTVQNEDRFSVLFQSTSEETADAYLVHNENIKFKFSSVPQCILDGALEYIWVSKHDDKYELEWKLLKSAISPGEPLCKASYKDDGTLISFSSNDSYYCETLPNQYSLFE